MESVQTKLMDTIGRITSSASSDMDLKRENANIDGDSSMGSMLRVGSEAYKEWCLTNIVSKPYADAHISGDIHIHDLDFDALTTTCCQIDIKKLFHGGFNTGHGFLREPNSIGTAAALAAIAIQSNQNDQHGGQSIPNFDYGLAPYIGRSFIKNLKKIFDCMDMDDRSTKDIIEKLEQCYERGESVLDYAMEEYGGTLFQKALAWTEKDTYQAMEGFVHNLNTMHSRAGAQVPFSSINYGTDTSTEGRMVIRNILLAEEAGLGNGETPIFPIHIFKVRNGYTRRPEDKNHDLFKLACRVSSKRLFPNFSYQDTPFNAEYLKGSDPNTEVAYMGCRTRVMANRCGEATTFGRGNLSFTSINLPRLGIKHMDDVFYESFFDELKEKCQLVIGQLLERFEVQCKRKAYNYPFLMGQGVWRGSENLKPDDEVRSVLSQGTLTIGFIGLAECLKALVGKHHGEDRGAWALGYEIVKTMRKACDKAGEKYGLNITLIATPAEGLSGRFVKIDREKYGNLPGITDRPYYTNSFHIPVYYPISYKRKIDAEAPFHALTNGGHISYVEVDGDPQKNQEAFEKLVLYMAESGMGYASINHPVDRDPVCGFTGIINDECPRCGRHEGDGNPKFERIRRITGYLVGTTDRFNDGKAAEERDRVKHFNMGSK